jgi:hypothetical protein
MVKKQKKNSRKRHASKRFNAGCQKAGKINTSTEIETCSE